MDRKNFFKNGLKDMAEDLLKTPLGKLVDQQLQSLSNLLAPEWLNDRLLSDHDPGSSENKILPLPAQLENHMHSRPPGAIVEVEKFNQACTRCNDCILACPHGALFNLGPYSGPVMDPNRYPCYLCEDWPCIKACETGALTDLPKNTYPAFGMAVLLQDNCLNAPESRNKRNASSRREPYCRSCLKSCPIEAVSLTKEKLPEFEDFCTGCGLCAQACPAEPVAIHIVV